MNARTPLEQTGAPMLTREQVAGLLCRYPHVSDAEAKMIVRFIRAGRHLDVGMLTADEALRPQLDSFMEDHGKHFHVGVGEATAVIAAIAGFLLVCWLLWEAVKPGAL